MQEWSANLVWEDSHHFAARLKVGNGSRSRKFRLVEDQRQRLATEPRRGRGTEADILSDWLNGFQPAAFDPIVRANAEAAERAQPTSRKQQLSWSSQNGIVSSGLQVAAVQPVD